MSFKVIKKGQFAYKRVGKFKTDYRVMFRQNGIYLNEKLIDVVDDKDALAKTRKRIAEVEYLKSQQDLIQKQIEEKSPLVRFETIMDQVIASKPVPSTRATAEHYLKKVVLPILQKRCPFVKDFGPTGPEDFVMWFQNERPGQKIFNARKYFLQVLKRARKLGLLNSQVVIEMKNPDPKRQAGKVYSDEEIQALFEHASSDLKLQILMAYKMGMRRSEILKLRWDRLNIHRQTIALKPEDTKIRRGREFKVPGFIWDILMTRREGIKSPYVFPSPADYSKPTLDNKSAWQGCKKKAKVSGRFHDLRHTFLTHMIARERFNTTLVCEYAGLSNDELRETYLHATYQDTAFIADNQDEKMGLSVSIDKKFATTFATTFDKDAICLEKDAI